MNNVMTMTIVHTGNDLLKESSRFTLFQFTIFYNIVKKFAAGNVFHDHKNVGWCTDNLIPIDVFKLEIIEMKMIKIHYNLII